MAKVKFQTVQGVIVYPIDYLAKEELSDTDLSNLLDNNKKGLMYSLIIDMFRHINNKKTNLQIINMIKNDSDWYNKIVWKKEEHDAYENLVINVYKNVYQFNETIAKSLGEWFMTLYGFKVENNTIDL